jgi:hypothetical protein
MANALLPDAEVLVIGFLASHPDLNPLISDRVGTDLDARLPAIRVTRLSRPPRQDWEDNPELQIDCWAETQEEASVLARTVVSVLPDIVGVHVEGAVRSYEVILGPFWSPDPDANYARYLVDAAFLTYPNP